MPYRISTIHSLGRDERGVVLVIALIMLVMITMIGVSTMQTTTQEERMAGNTRDRSKAFLAAEAAVQFCLAKAKAGTAALAAAGITSLTPSTTATPQWDDAGTTNGWTNSNSIEVDIGTTGTSLSTQGTEVTKNKPRCMVEDLTNNSYRVTGRATGGSADTVVMLQATYTTE